MNITLEKNEAELLHRVLTNYLGDFRMEISNTENYEWRESMKEDEATIKALIKRLAELGAASATA
jgi:hypothetical protein